MTEPHDRSGLHHSTADSDVNVSHRLATSASGSSGSTGNPDAVGDLSPDEMLDLLTATAQQLLRRSVKGTNPAEVRQWAQQALELRRRAVELADAYEQALMEEGAGHILARRIERMTRPHQKRLNTDRLRSKGGLYAGEARSPNRPTNVEVDPTAWAVVKADAIRNRTAVAAAIGRLVAQSLDQSVQPTVQWINTPVQSMVQRDSRPAAPDSGPRPRPEVRFARLFIDDETWLRFRRHAAVSGVTTARNIGLIVEGRARTLGWRP